jgi:hypothetical protein
MKAELSGKQRILVGSILTFTFLLVLGSNLLDRRHFETIQRTVSSIYHDRIMVQDYIYKLRNHIYVEELALIEGREKVEPYLVSQKIQPILNDYKNTVLTPEESKFLERLIHGFSGLETLGLQGMAEGKNQDALLKTKKALFELKKNLDALEAIQIEESKRLTKISEKSLGINMMLSNLEITFLVLIGMAIALLAFQPIKTLNLVHRN